MTAQTKKGIAPSLIPLLHKGIQFLYMGAKDSYK